MSNAVIESNLIYTEDPSALKFNPHFHETYEIYCFLSGDAKYFVEGNIYPLKPGDILIMKKAESHSLLINSNIPYQRIFVNFNSAAIVENVRSKIVSFLDNRPLGIKNRYSSSLFTGMNWSYYLKKLCASDDINEKSLYLTVLLSELQSSFYKIKTQETSIGEITDIVEFINTNLSGELNLDIICERFFISQTHLKRKFKKTIGSTVWKYIVTKRLILAKELLASGMRPTEVYSKCGFNDYCTFFRAYKSNFGTSPKNDFVKNTSG